MSAVIDEENIAVVTPQPTTKKVKVPVIRLTMDMRRRIINDLNKIIPVKKDQLNEAKAEFIGCLYDELDILFPRNDMEIMAKYYNKSSSGIVDQYLNGVYNTFIEFNTCTYTSLAKACTLDRSEKDESCTEEDLSVPLKDYSFGRYYKTVPETYKSSLFFNDIPLDRFIMDTSGGINVDHITNWHSRPSYGLYGHSTLSRRDSGATLSYKVSISVRNIYESERSEKFNSALIKLMNEYNSHVEEIREVYDAYTDVINSSKTLGQLNELLPELRDGINGIFSGCQRTSDEDETMRKILDFRKKNKIDV